IRHSPHGVAVLSLVTSGIGPAIMGRQSEGTERRVLYEVGVHSLLATVIALLLAVIATLLAILAANTLAEMGLPINTFTAVVIIVSPTLPIFAGFFVAYVGSLTRCERFMREPAVYTPRGLAGAIARRLPYEP
ncbi:MAG: hypothetical protein AAGD00_07560, partial [Planctomycetota bacterium]